MHDSIGSKGKIMKGAGRLNLVREQGAGKHQKSRGSKKNVKKGGGGMVINMKGAGRHDPPPFERLTNGEGLVRLE